MLSHNHIGVCNGFPQSLQTMIVEAIPREWCTEAEAVAYKGQRAHSRTDPCGEWSGMSCCGPWRQWIKVIKVQYIQLQYDIPASDPVWKRISTTSSQLQPGVKLHSSTKWPCLSTFLTSKFSSSEMAPTALMTASIASCRVDIYMQDECMQCQAIHSNSWSSHHSPQGILTCSMSLCQCGHYELLATITQVCNKLGLAPGRERDNRHLLWPSDKLEDKLIIVMSSRSQRAEVIPCK